MDTVMDKRRCMSNSWNLIMRTLYHVPTLHAFGVCSERVRNAPGVDVDEERVDVHSTSHPSNLDPHSINFDHHIRFEPFNNHIRHRFHIPKYTLLNTYHTQTCTRQSHTNSTTSIPALRLPLHPNDPPFARSARWSPRSTTSFSLETPLPSHPLRLLVKTDLSM